MRAVVAVLGPADADDDEIDEAYRMGRGLAEAGAVVLTGGLGGVMEAAARGAREVGGTAVGVLPGSDRSEANEHLTVAIATGLGQARNVVMVRTADAVVSIGGSWGTLSEVAIACRLGRPVVCIRGWRVQDSSGADPAPGPLHVDDPESALTALRRVLR